MSGRISGNKRAKKIGFGLIGVILILVIGYFAMGYMKKSAEQEKIDKIIKKSAMFTGVTYESFSVDILTGYYTITNIDITPRIPGLNPVSIARITYKYEKDEHGGFNLFDIKIEGLKTRLSTLKMQPVVAKALRQLNMLNLDMNLAIDYRYKPDSKEMLLKFHQEFNGIGSLNFGIIMSNVVPGSRQTYQQKMDARLNHVRLQYVDQMFVKTLVNALAKKQGLSKVKMFAQMDQQLQHALAKQKMNSPMMLGYVKKIIQFLKDPQNITIDINPKPAMSGSEMEDLNPMIASPDKIAKRLNVKIYVNQKLGK